MNRKTRSFSGPNFESIREEFFAQTKRVGDDLVWTGRLESGKYPVVWFESRLYRAHNVAWCLANGWLTGGSDIRRTCSNPLCVDPAHYEINGPTARYIRLIKQEGEPPDGLPDACVNWIRSTDRDGYGRYDNGKRAHRHVYELLVGPIPDGYDLHHKCRNRRCVNVNHLEPVPREQHRRAALQNAGTDPAASPENAAETTEGVAALD